METADLPDYAQPAPEEQPGTSAWWDLRYRSGEIPWDTGIVPPEVEELLAGQLAPGWALDLGCGSGVTSRYLASHGFRVVGLDLSLIALARAAEATRAANVPAFFCLADVSRLDFLDLCATFALDVGCFHAIPSDRRSSYVESLAARLSPRAFYLLYAFTWTLTPEVDQSPRGISPADIGSFAPHFILRWARHGWDRDRPSAWYLFERAQPV